jgi:guanylate kinase
VQGIILYGPPASGKDTVTRELEALDPRYRLFPRLKVGSGRTTGYRMATAEQLDQARGQGDILWENDRYGATYAIDRDELRRRLGDHVPVVHLGQVDAVQTIRDATLGAKWLIVYLRCPRDIARQRMNDRRTGDARARMRAWDETVALPGADLVIDTSLVSARAAALSVHVRLYG